MFALDVKVLIHFEKLSETRKCDVSKQRVRGTIELLQRWGLGTWSELNSKCIAENEKK